MYKEDNLNTQNPPLVNTSQMCQIIWHFQQKQGSTKQNGILGIFELQTRCWQHKKSSSLKTRNCEIIIWPINLLGHDSSGSHSSSFYFFAANIVFLIDLICQKVKPYPKPCNARSLYIDRFDLWFTVFVLDMDSDQCMELKPFKIFPYTFFTF